MAHGDDIFFVEYTSLIHGCQEDALELGTPSTPPASTSAWQGNSSGMPVTTPVGVQFVSPPQDFDEELDADHNEDAPLDFRTVDDVVGLGSQPGYVVHDLGNGELLAMSAEEPASLFQVKKEACWRRAMEEELQSIEENGT